MKPTLPTTLAAALALVVQGCTSAGTTLPSYATPGTSTSSTQLADATTATSSFSGVNRAALPLDDANYTTSRPKRGWIYSCQGTFNGGGASVDGPWIDLSAGTWNSLTKPSVEGAATWSSTFSNTSSGSTRSLSGNGLPSHKTGIYPISPSDPAYKYDRNPNSIAAQSVAYSLPSDPKVAAAPSCVGLGPIGIMLTGAQLFNALDAAGHDAPAHEVLDVCNGHPDQSGTYHYHSLSACMSDPGSGHSHLLGYAADGFGIYGVRGSNGAALTDAALDVCHGHTHAIAWNGKSVVMYHYHMTYEYPYSLGCYRGTPAHTGP